jgi:hypothetical protein
MRQNEYTVEKNSYKQPEFIQKQDKKFKKKHPSAFRYHIFVILTILSINGCKATVIYEKQEKQIILQNIDSYFYFNECRKKKLEDAIKRFYLEP